MIYDDYKYVIDYPILDYTPTRGKFRPLKRHAPPKGIKATVKKTSEVG